MAQSHHRLSRRRFLATTVLASGALVSPRIARRAVAQTGRPALPSGIQAGEVGAHRAVVWAATDRPARLLVEYATTDRFEKASRLLGPAALPETGFTARAVLDRPAGRPGRLLPGDLPRPGRHEDDERPRGRQASHVARPMPVT